MMKPIMHLCIKDLESIEINISELNITLLKAKESPRVTFEHISQPEFTDENL